jgi:uroporphyrinogen decarboxylase
LTGKQRINRVLGFEEADRVPRAFAFSNGFRSLWSEKHGWDEKARLLEHFGSDMVTVAANETPWPSRSGVIKRSEAETIERDAWGSVILSKSYAALNRIVEPALKERTDPDSLHFDDPLDEARYRATEVRVKTIKDSKYVVCKTGGPYIRATKMRGIENFLVDMVEDPTWVRAFVDRLTDHLAAVGVESIRRFGLQDTGIIVHDDVCSMRGPVMGLKTYEKVLYPSVRKMIRAYKEAGAARYIQHCDGDIRPLLDLWVDAGVDALHPCETRAGLDPMDIKKKYGDKLAMFGFLDSSQTLPRGNIEEIHEHIVYLLESARGGGLVIGAGILEDVSVDTMEYVLRILKEKSQYPIEDLKNCFQARRDRNPSRSRTRQQHSLSAHRSRWHSRRAE